MANPELSDPFISTEEAVEVDEETLKAIDEGIQAAEEGRVVPAEEVPAQIAQWISNFSTPSQR
jgi:predicted transcriptional regulator